MAKAMRFFILMTKTQAYPNQVVGKVLARTRHTQASCLSMPRVWEEYG